MLGSLLKTRLCVHEICAKDNFYIDKRGSENNRQPHPHPFLPTSPAYKGYSKFNHFVVVVVVVVVVFVTKIVAI